MESKERLEMLKKLKYLIKKKGDLEAMAESLQLENYEVLGLIEMLKREGENIEVVGNTAAFVKTPPMTHEEFIIPQKEDVLRFLMVSDTHYASKYDNVYAMHKLYEEVERRGIDIALHCGDITDGRYPSRPGNELELRALSVMEQAEYTARHYPRFSGKTYAIAGNHDKKFWEIAGVEVGKEIAKLRDDFIYLGQDVADLKIGKVSVRLFHGTGAGAYSRSYRAQKYLDNLDPRPDIAGFGHVHYAYYMKYLGTHVLQTASMQKMNPYIKSKGLSGDMSAWIVEAGLDSKGKICSFTPELIEFQQKKLTYSKYKRHTSR